MGQGNSNSQRVETLAANSDYFAMKIRDLENVTGTQSRDLRQLQNKIDQLESNQHKLVKAVDNVVVVVENQLKISETSATNDGASKPERKRRLRVY